MVEMRWFTREVEYETGFMEVGAPVPGSQYIHTSKPVMGRRIETVLQYRQSQPPYTVYITMTEWQDVPTVKV